MLDNVYRRLCNLRKQNDNLGLVFDEISAVLKDFEAISVKEIHNYSSPSNNSETQKVFENMYQYFELLLEKELEPLSSLNLLGGFINNQPLQIFHRSLNEASNSVLTVENWDDILFVILFKILKKRRDEGSVQSELEFKNLKDGVIKQVLTLFQRRLMTFGLDSNFTIRVMSDNRYREYRGHLIPLLVAL